MTLVVEDVTRFALHHTYLGRPAINVLDFHIHTHIDGPVTDRRDAIEETKNKLIDNWHDFVAGNLSNQVSFEKVSWVDLNTEDGETGESTEGNDESLPVAGGGGGEPNSAQNALLVTKQTSGGRSSRNGRMFIAGIPELQISGNLITGTYLGNVQDALDTFLTAMTDTGLVTDFDLFMVVVHTKNVGTPEDPIIELVNATQVSSLVLDQRIASQRRRNRG